MKKALNNRETTIKQLTFRSWHRGWKETDLILGRFADAELDNLNDAQLVAYAALLECDDDQIWRWITGKEAAPAELEAMVKLLDGYGKFTG